jgi:hypothetical protein
MLTISDKYEKPRGAYSFGVYNVIAPNRKELTDFFNEAKNAVGRKQLFDDELENNYVVIEERQLDIVNGLVYRFNMHLAGKAVQADKKLFLDQFSLEAIKSVIYATDFFPLEMTIDHYAAAILKAWEDYGDSILFANRIINIAGASNHKQMAQVSQQIDMIINLMTIPFADLLPPVSESIPSISEDDG